MALRTILTQGDPVLNKRAHDLIDDMRETLTDAEGLGLAAPQIGILRRVVIVINEKDEMLELVNPEIIDQSGEQEGLEGCLSVPGYYGEVKRPAWVKVRAQDRNGNFFEVEGTEMTARCFCHELAHLEGQLYTEIATRMYTVEELDEMLEKESKKGEGKKR